MCHQSIYISIYTYEAHPNKLVTRPLYTIAGQDLCLLSPIGGLMQTGTATVLDLGFKHECTYIYAVVDDIGRHNSYTVHYTLAVYTPL